MGDPLSRVVQLPRRKAAPVIVQANAYETVTLEERQAADELLRAAQALHRLTANSFVASSSLAHAPALLEMARNALSSLTELLA